MSLIINSLFEHIWEDQQDVKSFTESYNQFLDSIFTLDSLRNDSDESFRQLLMRIAQEVIRKGNEKNGIVKPMTDKLLSLMSQSDSAMNEHFIPIFMSLLVFGDVFKKDRKSIRDMEIYIEALGESFGTNQLIKA